MKTAKTASSTTTMSDCGLRGRARAAALTAPCRRRPATRGRHPARRVVVAEEQRGAVAAEGHGHHRRDDQPGEVEQPRRDTEQVAAAEALHEVRDKPARGRVPDAELRGRVAEQAGDHARDQERQPDRRAGDRARLAEQREDARADHRAEPEERRAEHPDLLRRRRRVPSSSWPSVTPRRAATARAGVRSRCAHVHDRRGRTPARARRCGHLERWTRAHDRSSWPSTDPPSHGPPCARQRPVRRPRAADGERLGARSREAMTSPDTTGLTLPDADPEEIATVDRIGRDHAGATAEAGAKIASGLGATAERVPTSDARTSRRPSCAIAERARRRRDRRGLARPRRRQVGAARVDVAPAAARGEPAGARRARRRVDAGDGAPRPPGGRGRPAPGRWGCRSRSSRRRSS